MTSARTPLEYPHSPSSMSTSVQRIYTNNEVPVPVPKRRSQNAFIRPERKDKKTSDESKDIYTISYEGHHDETDNDTPADKTSFRRVRYRVEDEDNQRIRYLETINISRGLGRGETVPDTREETRRLVLDASGYSFSETLLGLVDGHEPRQVEFKDKRQMSEAQLLPGRPSNPHEYRPFTPSKRRSVQPRSHYPQIATRTPQQNLGIDLLALLDRSAKTNFRGRAPLDGESTFDTALTFKLDEDRPGRIERASRGLRILPLSNGHNISQSLSTRNETFKLPEQPTTSIQAPVTVRVASLLTSGLRIHSTDQLQYALKIEIYDHHEALPSPKTAIDVDVTLNITISYTAVQRTSRQPSNTVKYLNGDHKTQHDERLTTLRLTGCSFDDFEELGDWDIELEPEYEAKRSWISVKRRLVLDPTVSLRGVDGCSFDMHVDSLARRHVLQLRSIRALTSLFNCDALGNRDEEPAPNGFEEVVLKVSSVDEFVIGYPFHTARTESFDYIGFQHLAITMSITYPDV
ncbi:hypothetical protein BDN72DRAFT_861124 [Pluteus cervinus]|uniref:Uncharacterized protein n=1 Tax=Pluteus cervinus TaxID=181527 RepID=A0ACD3AH00_9AGAR|nr:hypothetical protein BDN72DRAFT_861124 [Pluteus cervinus]